MYRLFLINLLGLMYAVSSWKWEREREELDPDKLKWED